MCTKEDLRALSNFGIDICLLKKDFNVLQSTGVLLAQLVGESVTYTYGTDIVGAEIPGSKWLNLDSGYLLKTKEFPALSVDVIDNSLLFGKSAAGDVEINIKGQCDGLVRDFGHELWAELKPGSVALSDAIDSEVELKSLVYSDAYICSSWNLMLLAEVVDGLKSNLSGNWNNPRISLLTGNKPPNPHSKGLYAEWADSSEKSDVITEYFYRMGENINVDIRSSPDIAHGRVLTLSWADGNQFTVHLDHGFGCWSIDGKTSKWFDINNTAKGQVSELHGILNTLKVRFSKKFSTQVFIKKISTHG